MTTQQKFAEVMATLAGDHDLDLVTDTSAANVGRSAFQRRDSFAPILTVHFNFQAYYASFEGAGVPREFHHVTGGELDRVCAWIANALRELTTDPAETRAAS